jgi:cytochrome P450
MMISQLKVTFESGNLEEMIDRFGKQRSEFPFLSLREYFTAPQNSLAPEIKEDKHVIAFTYNLPNSPKRVWYFIKTAEVAQKVLNAPRYASQESGKPWGEGAHTAILRSGLAVDQSPGAGTNNVMTTTADKHETFRKPLRDCLIKDLEAYITRIANSVESWISQNTAASVMDLNAFCRGLIQNAVLSIIGLPENTVTMDEISKLNGLAHEIAKGQEGANERMRTFRQSIDKKVVEGMKYVNEGTLFWSLKQRGYTDLACRETIIALMIGARNGSTALIQLLWVLARDPKMQKEIAKEVSKVHQEGNEWSESLKKMPILQNLFRYSLLTHSPVRTMNRNAINPMVLTISDEKGEESYGIYPGDRVDYLMLEAARATSQGVDISSCLKEERISMAHIPFGIGPNRCPASRFIESIAMITAAKLINRFELSSGREWIDVIPNVFVNEFVDEAIPVKLAVWSESF